MGKNQYEYFVLNYYKPKPHPPLGRQTTRAVSPNHPKTVTTEWVLSKTHSENPPL